MQRVRYLIYETSFNMEHEHTRPLRPPPSYYLEFERGFLPELETRSVWGDSSALPAVDSDYMVLNGI